MRKKAIKAAAFQNDSLIILSTTKLLILPKRKMFLIQEQVACSNGQRRTLEQQSITFLRFDFSFDYVQRVRTKLRI